MGVKEKRKKKKEKEIKGKRRRNMEIMGSGRSGGLQVPL